MHRYTCSDYGDYILRSVRDAVGTEGESSRNILLVSSNHMLEYSFRSTLRLTGTYPMNREVCVVHVRSPAQMRLLELGQASDDYEARRNVRAIQKRIRDIMGDCSLPILERYANWDFLKDSKAFESLSAKQLSDEQVESLAELMHHDLDIENMQKVVLGAERREEILSNWKETTENNWFGFIPKIQTVIHDIERDNDGQYEWEKHFLNMLVNPGKLALSYHLRPSIWIKIPLTR